MDKIVHGHSGCKLDSIFIGMEGVAGIADDMVIVRRDEMEHDRNFLAFMEKCLSNNLTLNAENIQFKQSQVSFCHDRERIFQGTKFFYYIVQIQ